VSVFVTLLTAFVVVSCSPAHVVSDRYLDPDPLLLAAPHGSGDEVNSVNPRFHALNQALVQLVSLVIISHTRHQYPPVFVRVANVGEIIDLRTNAKCCACPRCFVAPIMLLRQKPRKKRLGPSGIRYVLPTLFFLLCYHRWPFVCMTAVWVHF
jgi:hypothetical protein